MQKAETIKKETIIQAGKVNLILPEYYKVNNPAIIARIKSDLSSWQINQPHYLFLGSVGCGKSFLAQIIINNIKMRLIDLSSELYEKCIDVNKDNYWDALNYNSPLRDQAKIFNDHSNSIKMIPARDLHRSYLNKDNKIPSIPGIFCLDDLGAEPDTQSAKELMITLLTSRYELFSEGKSDLFIVTTNLSSDDLSFRYGDRIVDRLTEMCTIMKFKPHSFRQDRREIIEG